CFYLRLPFNVSFVISNCSAIFVSIERLIATLKTRTYEHGYRNVGYCLIFLQVTVSSCLLCLVYSQTKLNLNPLYYCQTTSRLNFMWTIYPFCGMLMMQTIKLLKVYVYTNVTFTATFLTAVGLVIFNNHLFLIPTYYALV
ncbi:hypothetical protein OSTOST_06799, partial [Ostertagia ostertagi]